MVTKADISHVIARAVRREIKDPTFRKRARGLLLGLHLTHFEQDNFTIITLTDDTGFVLGAGAAKRMPDDDYDPTIGYNLALVRAVDVAAKDLAYLSNRVENESPSLSDQRS